MISSPTVGKFWNWHATMRLPLAASHLKGDIFLAAYTLQHLHCHGFADCNQCVARGRS